MSAASSPVGRPGLSGVRQEDRHLATALAHSVTGSTLSVMSSTWQYTCTTSDDVRPAHLAHLMAKVAGDGWELVSASVHKVSAAGNGPGMQMVTQEDRCTMFWRKPADEPAAI
jgi:hypothetical protein